MSRKNRVMEQKNRKVRIESMKASKASALRHSQMEYHFGDWKPIKDNTDRMYHKTSAPISDSEALKNPNLTLSEIMALRIKRANIAIKYGC